MNKHDEEEHLSGNESWTDKFMNILFPSLQISPSSDVESESTTTATRKKEIENEEDDDDDKNKIPETTPSDEHYDDVQKSTNEEINQSWEKEATTIAHEVDKHALNQHPDIKKEVIIDGGSDDNYDDAQAEIPNEYVLKDLDSDVNRTMVSDKHRFDKNNKAIKSEHQIQRLKDQKEELENQPPPEFRDHPPYDVVDNKKERHRLRKQKLVEEQDILGKQSHFDNDFENWSPRPRQLS